jgi:hypothetical protein
VRGRAPLEVKGFDMNDYFLRGVAAFNSESRLYVLEEELVRWYYDLGPKP